MRASSSVSLRGATAILVAVFLLLFAAGCGGGDGDGGSTASGAPGVKKPVSKKVYIKKADSICKDVPKHYEERLQALDAKLKGTGKKPSRSEQILKAAVPPLYVAVRELRLVASPKGDEEKAKAFIEALQAGIDGLEKKPTSKLSGPGSPLAEFANLTEAYGFEYCSSL